MCTMFEKVPPYIKGFDWPPPRPPVIKYLFEPRGLCSNLKVDPDYLPVNEDNEEEERRLENCLKEVHTFRYNEWELTEPRRHGTFINGQEILYFPMLYGRHRFHLQLEKFQWINQASDACPDKEYINLLQRVLISASQRFSHKKQGVKFTKFMIHNSMYCLNWFQPSIRQHFIRLIGVTLLEEEVVRWISAENAQFALDDGIRMLLALSLATGDTLEVLHLWKFWKVGSLPLKSLDYQAMSIKDPFVKTKKKQQVDSDTLNHLWDKYVMQNTFYIPADLRLLVIHVAYQSFRNLTTLSVEYSYLSDGQGENLLFFGCIKSGTLRTLNLLFTLSDIPQRTQRYISPKAWKIACRQNPKMRVNLIALRALTTADLHYLLVKYIPLEGIHLFAGFTYTTGDEDESVNIDHTWKLIFTHYKRFIKRVTLHMWRPRTYFDYILSRILKLPFLEEFEYKGSVDTVMTLHAVLRFLLDCKLRIRKFHIYISEDPCKPEPYQKVARDLFSQYEGAFISKGIDLMIGTGSL